MNNYSILIDNEVKHIIDAQSVGVIPILCGNNPDYDGHQTESWDEIPLLIDNLIKRNFNRENIYDYFKIANSFENFKRIIDGLNMR